MIVVWLLVNYVILFFPGVLFRQLRWASGRDGLPWIPILWLTFFSILGGTSMALATFTPDFYFLKISWVHNSWLQGFGVTLHTACLVGCLWAQRTMSNSWRLPTVEVTETKIIQSGPYSIMRHPIYFFVFGTNLGLFMCFPDPLTLTLVVLSGFIFRHFAILEENWMLKSRGHEYGDFMSRVPRWGFGKRV